MALQRRYNLKNDTVSRVMAAAEELFAERGQEDVSLRELTSRAGVNMSAVNYHFGSKERLTDAVFERLVQRVSAQRKIALQELPDPNNDQRAYLVALLKSFIEPYLGDGNEIQGHLLARFFLRHRIYPTVSTSRIVATYLNPIAADYIKAFGRAAPQVRNSDFYWRYLFMADLLIISNTQDTSFDCLSIVSAGKSQSADRVSRRDALLRFLIGAFGDAGEESAARSCHRE